MPEKCYGSRYVVIQMATTVRHNGANAVEAIPERVSHWELCRQGGAGEKPLKTN